MSDAVGMCSWTKRFSKYEMIRFVFPTAASPTITHLTVERVPDFDLVPVLPVVQSLLVPGIAWNGMEITESH